MRITLRQLVAFDAVARTGSVSEAARQISLTQSAVSMALQELENHLGCELFFRQHKRLTLNEYGRKLQPKARSMLLSATDIEMLREDKSHRGTLIIGASTIVGNYVLPEICAAFLQAHPHVNIELQIHSPHDVIDLVDSMQLNLGFIESPNQRKNLRTIPWHKDELVIFAAPSHPLTKKKSLTAQDLKDQDWSLLPRRSASRNLFMISILKHLTKVNVRLESSSTETIKRTVHAGTTLGCLSRHAVAEELQAGMLKELRVSGLKLTYTNNIIARADVHLGEIYEDFINTAIKP